MTQTLTNHVVTKYARTFTVEWGIDAKAFFNYYHKFYVSGSSFQALRLIAYKHFVATANVTLPLPTKRDPQHSLTFSLTSQNDLKKNLGVSTIKVVDNFRLCSWLKLKNTLKLLAEGWAHTVQFQLELLNKKLVLDVSNETTLENKKL